MISNFKLKKMFGDAKPSIPAKIQRVQQKIPGCWTYVQQNENKLQKV
jgi:hypothetical protein